MKRYLLFAGSDYYPAGGAKDLIGQFDTPEEAQSDPRLSAVGVQVWLAWAHILDTQTGTIKFVKPDASA